MENSKSVGQYAFIRINDYDNSRAIRTISGEGVWGWIISREDIDTWREMYPETEWQIMPIPTLFWVALWADVDDYVTATEYDPKFPEFLRAGIHNAAEYAIHISYEFYEPDFPGQGTYPVASTPYVAYIGDRPEPGCCDNPDHEWQEGGFSGENMLICNNCKKVVDYYIDSSAT